MAALFFSYQLGFALPNSQAPRSPAGGDSPARATPNVRPIGRAVKLDCLPPPPLCLPSTRPLPTFRGLSAFLCFAVPFFLVTPSRFPPLFETRRARPPVLRRPVTPRLPPARVEPALRLVVAMMFLHSMIRTPAEFGGEKRLRRNFDFESHGSNHRAISELKQSCSNGLARSG